ncbi:hypothetical protein L2E82_33913 [Cichorium intybus]|uniref:Uncharacterized protein n=1 Tax=Cichorium intybus TaxID=13427 RepID=A0ACB9BLA9_CICIN|nr:hypothetical protein L2E82_33913 [Cichorium intybus]
MLSYKVNLSNMADVFQKNEHLEGVLGNDVGLSSLAFDFVHYNPSDLSSGVESMICKLNPTVQQPIIGDSFLTDLTSTGDEFVTPSGNLDSKKKKYLLFLLQELDLWFKHH